MHFCFDAVCYMVENYFPAVTPFSGFFFFVDAIFIYFRTFYTLVNTYKYTGIIKPLIYLIKN